MCLHDFLFFHNLVMLDFLVLPPIVNGLPMGGLHGFLNEAVLDRVWFFWQEKPNLKKNARKG